MAKRRRITFDMKPEHDRVYRLLLGKNARGERDDYVTEAVERFENPPYKLYVPALGERVPLEPVIQTARQLTFLGLTLRTIPRYAELLQSRVRARVPMTFITIRPELQAGQPLYEALRRVTGEARFVDQFLEQVRASTQVIRGLRALGLEHGTQVQVRWCEEVPWCGLIIAVPPEGPSEICVSIYDNFDVVAEHPFFVIRRRGAEGERAYEVFHRYYEQLRDRSPLAPLN